MSDRKTYPDIPTFLNDLPELAKKAEEALKGQNASFLLKTKNGAAWDIHLNDGLFTVNPAVPGS